MYAGVAARIEEATMTATPPPKAGGQGDGAEPQVTADNNAAEPSLRPPVVRAARSMAAPAQTKGVRPRAFWLHCSVLGACKGVTLTRPFAEYSLHHNQPQSEQLQS